MVNWRSWGITTYSLFCYKGDNLGERDEIATAKSYRKTQQITSATHLRPTSGYIFKVVHKL